MKYFKNKLKFFISRSVFSRDMRTNQQKRQPQEKRIAMLFIIFTWNIHQKEKKYLWNIAWAYYAVTQLQLTLNATQRGMETFLSWKFIFISLHFFFFLRRDEEKFLFCNFLNALWAFWVIIYCGCVGRRKKKKKKKISQTLK